MSTKSEVLRDSTSCLNKASAHEPVFVLRAHDPHAAQAIRLWAQMSAENQPVEKLEGAYNVAAEFEQWHHSNVSQDLPVIASAQQRTYGPVDTAPSYLRKT